MSSRDAGLGKDGLLAALPSPRVISRSIRIFSSSRGKRRFRRASDVVVLVPALLALAGLVIAFPPSRLERSFAAFLDSFPGWLDPLWGFTYDFAAMWAVGLLLTAIVARRHIVTLQAVASIAVAGVVAVLSARLAVGRWPDLDAVVLLDPEPVPFPLVKIALSAATILAVAPHLVRPLQRAGRWVLALGVVGAMLVEPPAPSASLAALLIGLVAATVVRLAFGTSAGHPESSDVVASLAELGVEVRSLEPAARQPAGVFVARGEDADGHALLVKVYGRDAYDTQLLEKLWRTAWYQGSGPRLRLSRLQAVEHEALITLFARQAGVPTSQVVIAGESSSGDALIVLRDGSRPVSELAPERIDDELLGRAWKAIERLGAARIAHTRIDAHSLGVGEDGAVSVVDFARGTMTPDADELLTDRAQLLATTAALAGPQRAIAVAIGAIGAKNVAVLLPYLQSAAFAPSLSQSLDAAQIETDELRRQTAEAVGVEPPPLVRLRRVTWWTAIQTALLVLAATTIFGVVAGLDFDELASYLEGASWGWIAAAFVAAQLPRLTQAIATLGSVAASLSFGPVYAMQLATGYMNLALPSNFARMAINIRFFQRQGIPPAAAVTSGAIDSFASTVIQLILLGLLLVFSGSSVGIELDTPSDEALRLLLVLAVLVVVTAALVLVLVRRVRDTIAAGVRRWWPDVRAALLGLRASRKLGLLLGGSLATEVLFATTLGLFANALGFDIGLADLLLINISVSLLASFVPVPGGIGVAEFGLTVGLTAAGMPEEAALATALLYRVATFYLPPVWGFFAFRWLQRNAYL